MEHRKIKEQLKKLIKESGVDASIYKWVAFYKDGKCYLFTHIPEMNSNVFLCIKR